MKLRPFLLGWGLDPWRSAATSSGLRLRLMSGSEEELVIDEGRARLSSLEDPDPEDKVEIRLTGRR